MKRNLVVLSLLAMVSVAGACSTGKTANDNTAPKNGVVETNANLNQNMNANSAPSNVGVVTNDNGNQNTAGVRKVNANSRNQNGKGNSNKP